jgi:hypothetical protein
MPIARVDILERPGQLAIFRAGLRAKISMAMILVEMTLA